MGHLFPLKKAKTKIEGLPSKKLTLGRNDMCRYTVKNFTIMTLYIISLSHQSGNLFNLKISIDILDLLNVNSLTALCRMEVVRCIRTNINSTTLNLS